MPFDTISRQNVSHEPNPKVPHTGGFKVLFAGLFRTGTASLQTAFEEHLGMVPTLHGMYMVNSVDRLNLFYKCCVEEDTARRREMLAEWFDHYPASTDLPAFPFVDDLIEIYPDMQIVLNGRKSAEAWSKSAQTSLMFYSSDLYWMLSLFVPRMYWHHQIYVGLFKLWHRRHGISRREDMFSPKMYELHNAWVKSVAAKHDRSLLEYEVSQGWSPLSEFLNFEIPKDATGNEIDFPSGHESKEMQALKRHLIWRGLKGWTVAVVVAVISINLARRGVKSYLGFV